MKKIFILVLFLVTSLIHASEKSLELDFQVVSDYIFRGHNFFRDYSIQNKKSYASTGGAWAFQSSLTWLSPLDGLYVNLFSSFALTGREDKDIDNRIQTGPGKPFIQNRISLVDPDFLLFEDWQNSLPVSLNVIDYEKLPNFYKEPVGLKRYDELDIAIGYEKQTKWGTVGFGIMHYQYANVLSVGIPYGTEIFVSYAPYFLENLSFTIYEDIRANTIYYALEFKNDFVITEALSSEYSIGAGYYVMQDLQDVSDVSFSYLILHSSGFYMGLHAVYTPSTVFQEYFFGAGDPLDTVYDPATDTVYPVLITSELPVHLNGLSSIYDGKVVDPSQATGPVNEYRNHILSREISGILGIPYTYLPRQKLPKTYYWISLGYRTSL